MATNYIKPGDTQTIIAAAPHSSGDGVQVGTIFGVALTDIASGASGELGVVGVYSLPKNNSQAFAIGDRLFWDGTELTTTSTANEGVGWAASTELSAATTGQVRLGGVSTQTAI